MPADPNGFAGNVTAGSGDTYTVALIGVSPPTTVPVTVMGLDSGETLPVGFGLVIVKIGSSYYSTAPMWVD